MLDTKDLYWLAGILEGEGSFGIYGSSKVPLLSMQSTDFDVAIKVAKLLNTNYTNIFPRKPGYKRIYNVAIRSTGAISWMMTLYSLMSIRRKSKIEEVINLWKKSTIKRKGSRTQFSY